MAPENIPLQQAILDSANYTIISTTVDGIITTFNAAAERWLGYQATEIVGKTTPIIFHDREEVVRRAQELSQELGDKIEPGFEVFVAKTRRGEPEEQEWTYIRKDGSRFPVLLSVTALRDEEGKITGYLGIGSDITKRKQAETELERFFELSIDLLSLAGLDGYFKRINPAFAETLGYSQEELLTQSFLQFVHPEDRTATLSELEKLANRVPTLNFENRYLCKDGSYKWLAWKAFPVVEEELIYAVARDITEQKQAQKERSEILQREKVARSQITNILESITDAFFALDRQWCFTYLNHQAELLLQRKREELLGKNLWAEFPEAVGSTFDREYHRAVSQQVSVEFETFYPPLNGWFAVHAYPSFNGLSVYFQEISDRKKAELERRASEERLRKQQAALIELAKNKVFYQSDLAAAVRGIVEKAAQTLDVERVGVWFYNKSRTFIYLFDQYRQSLHQHCTGVKLLVRDYPIYFQALQSDEIVAADDVRSDERTRDLSDRWLIPYGITSMMDVPITSGGKTVGIICYEHVGIPRHWTIEEQNFANSLAYIISLAIEARDRAAAETALMASESKYRNLVETSQDLIWSVDRQGRYTFVNQAVRQIYGCEPKAMLGRSFTEAIVPERQAQEREIFEELLTGKPCFHYESKQLSQDGRSIYLLINAIPLRDTKGNLIGATGTASDITERKQSEEALRESEARFRQLAENIREVLWIRDVEKNQMIYISPAYESIWGHPRSQLYVLYSSFLDTIYPQDRDRFLAALARQNESGYDEEYRIVRLDGSIRWVHDRAFPIKNEAGRVYRIVGLAEDITDRKKAENELVRQNMRAQLFAELAFKIRQSLRLEEILQTAVTEVQKFLQADRVLLFRLESDGSGTVMQEEVIPPYPVTLRQKFLDPCFHEGYAEKYRQGRISAIVDLDQAEIDSCHRKFLQQFQVKANLVVPILQQDRLWGLLVAHQCSSPRQWNSFEIDLLQRLADQIGIALSQGQLVEALRESEERFRTMANTAPVFLWMDDTDKLCTFCNQGWLNFRGKTLEQEMGRGWQEGVHPDDLLICLDLYNTAFNKRESFQMEYRLQRADGEYRWMLSTGRPRFLPDGSFAGYIGSCVDISDRREVEKLKDEFISIVSHELRTPLTSIQGALDLLAGGVLADRPEYAQHMLKIAAKNADRLVRLINDILDIERIESGKVTMTKQVCDAAELMSSAVDAIENMAQQAKVSLSASPVSARLWVDPDRIIQILTNLLSNAIKFSPANSTVWLTAEILHREDVDSTPINHILFKVKDRGRGIPTDKIETIFGRFQQVDASDSRKKGGTGLGLAICRSIIQHHDGRIWAESTLGEGSTFCFTLPLFAEKEKTEINRSNDGPLILVCDDDASVREIVQNMLEGQNYRAMTVASGQEAVQQAILTHPDVILLNLMMPGMNGWETMTILKEQEATKDIPVIILSGLMPDARQSSHLEISDWIVKPPNAKLLFQTLERVINQQNQHFRILVVEDDLDLAQVLIAMFERHGIQTYHASTGREAINLSQSIMPNLLVLDLVLPEYDGFAVVDWLRQHNRLHHVPLVVYTAKDVDSLDKKRLKLGQTLFFTKGRITPEEFEQRVIYLLNRMIRHIDLKGENE